MNKFKKIAIIILSIILMIGIFLTTRYYINESFINDYEQENYSSAKLNILKLINFPQSYVVYYNKGNNYYNLNDYNKAIEQYEESLKRVSKKHECEVRTNLALANLKIIDYENSNTITKELQYVEEILLTNDCATKNNSGKNKTSQDLYNEIEALMKKQTQETEQESTEEQEQQQEQESTTQEEQLQQQLQQQQVQANEERNRRERRNYNYEYYNGKTW